MIKILDNEKKLKEISSLNMKMKDTLKVTKGELKDHILLKCRDYLIDLATSTVYFTTFEVTGVLVDIECKIIEK